VLLFLPLPPLGKGVAPPLTSSKEEKEGKRVGDFFPFFPPSSLGEEEGGYRTLSTLFFSFSPRPPSVYRFFLG